MNINQTNYVEKAENVIKNLRREDKRGNLILELTTSKIRNLLTLTNEIYNKIIREKEETLSDEMIGNVQYLKMRFAYEAGREGTVKKFVEKANLMEYLGSVALSKSKDDLLLFCNYMEALVAYHKFYGGKDR